MAGFIPIPNDNTFRLRRARVPAALLRASLPGTPDGEGLIGADFEIADGLIARIVPAGTFESAGALDLDGGQVWPCFVDLHTHLDISHIWTRAPNRDGTIPGALEASEMNRQTQWPADDIRRRIDFGLRCAYAHGVAAVRTHLDSQPVHAQKTWKTFRDMRDHWAGRIALQGVSLLPVKDLATDYGTELADLVASSGGRLGALINFTGVEIEGAGDEYQGWLDRLFALAQGRGLDLDLHVDESGDPGARSLFHIARTAVRRGFKGKLVCGHCCTLALQSDEVVDETLSACADAGIEVVSLPMCNMYLQDRGRSRTPRWRGVTLLHEMAARGIPVSLGSDDVRNAWFKFGDHDMVEVFTEAVRIAHLDYPYGAWPRAVTATPAAAMRLDAVGTIGEGAPADLVLFSARGMSELLSRPQSDRIVLRGGREIDRTLPDYRELDNLQVHPGAAR
jgi:cytosine deaminase